MTLRDTHLDSFAERLDKVAASRKSMVCVGLDPDPRLMPVSDPFEFNRRIVDATHDIVLAYKPQLAYYEALGLPGLHALEKTVRYIRDTDAEVLIVGDGKRGDIGPTAAAYAAAMFDVWGFDATTVYSYQGADSVEPFLQYPGRGVFIVCRTSNPSSREFQDLRIDEEHRPFLFQKVAEAAERWDIGGNIGLVVGATYPAELRLLRNDHPNLPFLIPGVGAQGGDVAEAVRAGVNWRGYGVLVNSARAVIYASKDARDYPRYARIAVESLRNEMNIALDTVPGT